MKQFIIYYNRSDKITNGVDKNSKYKTLSSNKNKNKVVYGKLYFIVLNCIN
jgi:hypothetical protein